MRFNPALDGLSAYVAPPPLDDIVAHYGLDHLVKLASNEYPDGPFPEVLAVLRGALRDLNRYPDSECVELRRALSAQLNVPEGHLVFGNGSCEVLMLLGQALLAAGDHVVYPDPSFVVYPTVGALRGAVMQAVPLRDHGLDLEAMLAAVSRRTRMVIVCNPNNPTGTAVDPEELRAFVAAVPADTVVVLDEAYIEFAATQVRDDTETWPGSRHNVVVLRTFSKIYGLAAMRIGYGVAHPDLVAALNKVRQPYNVTTLAQVAALESLRHPDRLQERVQHVADERTRISSALDELGIRLIPSQANFILVGLEGLTVPADEVPQTLLERGVLTRSGYAMGCPGWLRVTIGSRQENDLFLLHMAGLSRKGASS